MKRKFFALLLGALATVILMGTGTENPAVAADVTVGAVPEPKVTAAETATTMDQTEDVDLPLPEEEPVKENAEEVDNSVLVDGKPVPKAVGKYIERGVSYVSLGDMAKVLNPDVQVKWDADKEAMTISSKNLTITAVKDYSFIDANGRYLYVPNQVQVVEERVIVPLKVVAKAFDAEVGWEEASQTVVVTRGSGAIEPGDTFYDEDKLFWLSRVIYAESGGEVMKGMIAVGNVVLNRVASKHFPNTIYGVISQRNQFSTFKGGKLANRTPTSRCVIAAKIVLDGGVVPGLEDAHFFDSATNSWASRNKNCVAVIGGHRFYDY